MIPAQACDLVKRQEGQGRGRRTLARDGELNQGPAKWTFTEELLER